MEAFKIKNGLSAKRYLGSTTTLSSSTIDLSLGSMFSTTLSSDPAYTFTNPPASGNAQAFSVEVTGGTTSFTNGAFATTLYAGTGSPQTITNGLDLAGDGGLVWTKSRTNTYNNTTGDTESGTGLYLYTNTTVGHTTPTDAYISAYNSNGYDIGSVSGGFVAGELGASGQNYVSWSFKKQTKFFDIVTWTGDGNDNRQISHSLGSAPATIIIKSLNFSNNWLYNTNFGASSYDLLYLDLTNAASSQNYSTGAIKSAPTDSTFTLKNSSSVNGSGNSYVAYLFAHDTASDSRIKCGSYTTDSVDHATITLGWKPQWLLVKRSDNSAQGDWRIIDSVRGVTSAGDAAYLEANTTDAEAQTGDGIYTFTDTGFTQDNLGASRQYIYIAIRASTATDSAITWPSSVKWPAGVAPTTPAAGTKDLFTFLTTDGGTTYYGKKAAEGLA